MSIDYENDKMDELLRLTKENNRMLHAMRRSAWMSSIFRLIMWAVLFFVPLWLYMQYIAPIMQQVLQTYQQVQGTSAQASAQLQGLQQALQRFQGLYGGTKTQ